MDVSDKIELMNVGVEGLIKVEEKIENEKKAKKEIRSSNCY